MTSFLWPTYAEEEKLAALETVAARLFPALESGDAVGGQDGHVARIRAADRSSMVEREGSVRV